MLIIWRGLGWIVPIILIVAFVATNYFINSVTGISNFYEAHEWPKMTATAISALLIAAVGIYVNHVVPRNQIAVATPRRSHALFFIPIEYWALLAPALIGWSLVHKQHEDEQDRAYLSDPMPGDLYIVDLSKLAKDGDQRFKYSLVEVAAAGQGGIELRIGKVNYTAASGPRDDIRTGKGKDRSYYSEQLIDTDTEHLLKMKADEAILSVVRSGVTIGSVGGN